jgi:tetratricopeptide (TPR) repeat protein
MKKIFIALFSFLVPIQFVLGQDSFDPDELLIQAREMIFAKKYLEGRKVAFRALDKYPNYADILILVGRSYAWEGKNDSADIYLERAIVASPTYADGYVAYLDNLFWSDNYTKADEIQSLMKSPTASPACFTIVNNTKMHLNWLIPCLRKGTKPKGCWAT